MLKRIAVLFLPLILMCGSAMAAVTANGHCGKGDNWKNVYWVLYDTGTLVIGGTGEMQNMEAAQESDSCWHPYQDQVKKVVIWDGVTSVGDYAFQYEGNLQEVSLPDSMVSIGSNAFCETGILSITFPEKVAALGTKACYKCSSLSSVNFEGEVTSVGDSAFGYNTQLKEIALPDTVASIGESAFSYSAITAITIPEGVTEIKKQTFYSCESLQCITIPAGTVSIGLGAFWNASSLQSVTYGGREAQWTALMKTAETSEWNSKIVRLKFIQTQGDPGVYCMDRSLDGGSCGTNLTWKYYEDGTLEIGGTGAMSAGQPWSDYAGSIATVSLPAELTEIGSGAFKDCSVLADIELPAGLSSIGEKAFYNCAALEDIVIPEKVTEIAAYTFSGCASLKSAELSPNITVLGNFAFYGCSSLSGFAVPEKVEKIPYNAFSGCSSLKSVTFPDAVSIIDGYAFEGCGKLQELTLPAGLEEIGTNAFYGCSSLTEVLIPDKVTRIPYAVFAGCSALDSITIPAGMTEIGEIAFRDCTGLERVTFLGTRRQWNNEIQFGTGNDPLLNAPLYCMANIHHLSDGTCVDCGEAFPEDLPDSLILPSALEVLGSGAFAKSGAQYIFLPASMEKSISGKEDSLFSREDGETVEFIYR